MPIEHYVFSKKTNPIQVSITSSGTIIVETKDYDVAKHVVNSFILAHTLLTNDGCFMCQYDDLDELRRNDSAFFPAIKTHGSVSRLVASSKDVLKEELQYALNSKRLYCKDIIKPIMELAEKFYESKYTYSYMRTVEAIHNFSRKNYDVSFNLCWIQIELFLKRNFNPHTGNKNVSKIIDSLCGVDNRGNKVKRKTKICNKYISLKLANNIKKCYEERKRIVHEGKGCNEENALLCKQIAEILQLWRLVMLDKIEYDSLLEAVNNISK